MTLKAYCLICGKDVKLPEDLKIDGNATEYDILMWINDHCFCEKCYFLSGYFQHAVKIGVKNIEKLVKN
jgi:hypothetical protein